MDYQRRLLAGEDVSNYKFSGKIEDVPDNFKNWVNDNADRIKGAKKQPYFIQDNAAIVNQILHPKPKVLTALEKAQLRHETRTPEEITTIKQRWAERQHKHGLIKKTANNVFKVASDYGEVDYSKLQQFISAGNLTAMQKEARIVARQVSSIKKLEAALSALIPDAHVWHKQFSISELQAVYDAVEKKLDGLSNLSLEKQKSKLSFEIEWVQKHQKYSTWEVAQSAYKKQLEKVSDALDWEIIGNEFKNVSGFKTKSQPYLGLVAKLQEAITTKDKAAAQQTILDIQAKRAQLDKAAATRKKAKFKSQFGEDAYSQSRKDAAVWDKHDGSEADAALIDTAANNWRNATKHKKEFVYEYTTHYCDVNEPLQGRKYFNTQSKDRSIKKVNNITSYIAKNELPVDMWFTRGDNGLSVIKSRIAFAGGTMPSDIQDLVGMVMQEGGFMSTASRKGKGFNHRDVILNIYAPKGTKAAYIEPISAYGNGAGKSWDGIQKFSSFSPEHETLFQRGTQMRITRVYQESDKIYIDCEVVGQEVRDLSYVKDSDIGY